MTQLLSPDLMTDVFTLRENFYNISNIRLFGPENPRSVQFRLDAIAFRSSTLWQKVPITTIKDSSSLKIFKAEMEDRQWRIYIIYNIVTFNFRQWLLFSKLL